MARDGGAVRERGSQRLLESRMSFRCCIGVGSVLGWAPRRIPEHPDSGFKAFVSNERQAQLIEQAEEHGLPRVP